MENKSRDVKINRRLQEYYDYLTEHGYEVVYISLYGSQNYDLDVYTDKYNSDIDVKAVVLPSFEDFLENAKPISTSLILDSDGACDIKDIRIMLELYKKQNVQFLETLFTKFKIINKEYADFVNPLFGNREKIAHLDKNQALKCMAGMSKEKLNALCHPYPNCADKIKDHSYDEKQLHHIFRMNDFIRRYTNGETYESCLIPTNPQFLKDIKTRTGSGILDIEEAKALADNIDSDTNNIKDKFTTDIDMIDQDVINILNEVKRNCLAYRFKKQLFVEIMAEKLI